MKILRLLSILALFPIGLAAQGVTTGALNGTVTDDRGQALSSVQIQVTNTETGYKTGTMTREDGRYFLQNLPVGNYQVAPRRIGFKPPTPTVAHLGLSQNVRLDFKMETQATQLSEVVVEGSKSEEFVASNQGTKTIISESVMAKLPVLSRNLMDFVRSSPQVSTAGPGNSAGGMPNRMNNVQVDGTSERDVFGLGATGQPGAQANGRSVPLEAVKELQVLIAPYDVRQGAFGGLVVNAVTKSGTNELKGSAFYTFRNEKMGKDLPVLRSTPFERRQYGFSLGGPIVRDRLHFFITPEFVKENTPVSGPYAGQAGDVVPAFPLLPDSLARVISVLNQIGLSNAGTAGFVNIPNPITNVFARMDWVLNSQHRLVLQYNYGEADRLRQQNDRRNNRVVFASNFHDFSSVKRAPKVQLFSNFSNGWFNEAFASRNEVKDRRVPLANFPQISVSVGQIGGGSATVLAGADEFSQGNELDQKTTEFTDNLTIPRGRHVITVGTRNELVDIRNLFTQSSLGTWSFRNLDSLAAGNAGSFRRSFINSQGGNANFKAWQAAFYAQDEWQPRDNLTITAGVRADVPSYSSAPGYSAAVDSAFGRRTDQMPGTRVYLSPRLGFNWDLDGRKKTQLRGGIGRFMGPPPYVWLSNAIGQSGTILTYLNCNRDGNRDRAPLFNKDVSQVTACRSGASQASGVVGEVNFAPKSLRMAQPLRMSGAIDRQLGEGMVATLEMLYSKNYNNFFFVNRNLAGPRGVDRNGRVLYADTILTTGASRPVLKATGAFASRFTSAIDVENQSKDYAYNITGQIKKHFSNSVEGQIAYTFSRARDVQSSTSSTHISNWRFGRTLSTAQETPTLGRSLFEQPHRLQVAGTWILPWKSTEMGMQYFGGSGNVHDYVYAAGPTSGSGDLNGDGVQGNDLIYVPKNALDPQEIRFSGATATAQAQAFEDYIQGSKCLTEYRGRILDRNACTMPWTNEFNVSIRQRVLQVRGQKAVVQLDVFNVGNLINENWGQVRNSALSGNSNIPLLQHVGQTGTDAKTAQGIFTFNRNIISEYTVAPVASNFWRTQVSLRLDF